VTLAGQDQLRLDMQGISVRFGHRYALQDADLQLRAGEIHGLVGQNGSGKSTLVKVLAGIHAPEAGARIDTDSHEVPVPVHPQDLITARISFVHQDIGLVDTLSVFDNICVGRMKGSRIIRRVDRTFYRRAAREALDVLEADIDVDALVGTLSAAERTTVAIARGLVVQRDQAGVMILDEATGALPREALANVHGLLRRITDRGGAILLVSHNLEEVMAITDRVTVLRDGKVVAAGVETPSLSEGGIAKLMLGYEASLAIDRGQQSFGPRAPWVQITGLTGTIVADADLAVGAGEIVGITGLEGSGYEEMPYLLAGAGGAIAGTLTIGGTAVSLSEASIKDCLRAGVSLVPASRQSHGLAVDETLTDNISLPRIRQHGSRLYSGSGWQRREADQVIRMLDVRPNDASMTVNQLSGGNQQKVMLGKWLMGKPRLLLLHEPTQAVDIAARSEILRAIRSLVPAQIAVIIASQQANDLAAICDRVVIFNQGKPVAEVATSDPDEIIDLIYATPTERALAGAQTQQSRTT